MRSAGLPAGVVRSAAAESDDLGLLMDRRAHPLDQAGEAARELAGVDRGGVGRVEGSGPARDPQPLVQPRWVEELVATGQPEPLELAELRLERRGLVRPARDGQLASTSPVDVEVLGCRDVPDLIDGRVHGRVRAAGRIVAVEALEPRERDVHPRRAPAAVAAGRAEAGDVAFQQDDAQRRVGLQEVVGGPEPRVAGAEDGHVGVGRSVEGGPRGQVVRARLEPIGDRGIVAHSRWIPHGAGTDAPIGLVLSGRLP